MNVGDTVTLQVSASKTAAATIVALASDRDARHHFVFRLVGDGRYVVMRDTPHTAKVIV